MSSSETGEFSLYDESFSSFAEILMSHLFL